MKHNALLPALALLGLAAVPSHAQGLLLVPTDIEPNFSVTLNDLNNIDPSLDGAFAYIQAIGSGGKGAYNAGLFSFTPSLGQLEVDNNTGANSDPGGLGFADPTFNIGSDVNFTNLVLSETFADGSVVNSAPLFADPLGLDPTTITDNVDGPLSLFSAPLPPNGPALTSATLTGSFDAGQFPGQPVQVQIAYVPEPGTDALLLLGLGLVAAPLLRARRRAGRSNS